MEIADTFMPTAGVVGILPMVTYFFLLVTLFAAMGSFVFSLITLSDAHPKHRLTYALTAVITCLTAYTYYLIQAYYHDMLSELVAVTEAADRQTLIRESYNAIGQYRYLNWFITAPLLLRQLTGKLNARSTTERPLATLLAASSFLYFISYIGHQQLSFDNEIQIGAKAGWGLMATIAYGFILFILNRFGKQLTPADQRLHQPLALTVTLGWGIYLLGYFLTFTAVDFNWIHLLLTVTELISIIGLIVMVYRISSRSLE